MHLQNLLSRKKYTLLAFMFFFLITTPHLVSAATTTDFDFDYNDPGNIGGLYHGGNSVGFNSPEAEIRRRVYGKSFKLNVKSYASYLQISIDGNPYTALPNSPDGTNTPDLFGFSTDGWHEVRISSSLSAIGGAGLYSTATFEVGADGTPQLTTAQDLGPFKVFPSSDYDSIGTSTFNATLDANGHTTHPSNRYLKFKARTSGLSFEYANCSDQASPVSLAIDGVKQGTIYNLHNNGYYPCWVEFSGLDNTKEHTYTLFSNQTENKAPSVVMLSSYASLNSPGVFTNQITPRLKILALGDSQTSGTAWSNDASAYYDVFWNLRLGLTTLNRGISGNGILDADARLGTDVTPYNPDVVFLHLGYNNVGDPNFNSSYTTLINDVLAIPSVKHIIASGPTGEWTDSALLNSQVQAVVAAINNPKVTWADVSTWNQNPQQMNGHHSAMGEFQLAGDNVGAIQFTDIPSDGNTATITGLDGNSETFEFDSNSSVSNGHIAVAIGASTSTAATNLMTAVQAEVNAKRLDVNPLSFVNNFQYGIGLSANALAVTGANLVAYQPNAYGYITAVEDVLGPYTYSVSASSTSVQASSVLSGTVNSTSPFDGVSQVTVTLSDGTHTATNTITPTAGATSTAWTITVPSTVGSYTLTSTHTDGGSITTDPFAGQTITVTAIPVAPAAPVVVASAPRSGGGGSGSIIPTTVVTTTVIANSSPAPHYIFSQSLQTGSSGKEVKTLQQFLNSKGFVVSKVGAGSVGHETNLFGKATKEALIKFQKSVGITPASGYFGPITRAYIAKLSK